MENRVDAIRHFTIFNPEKFASAPMNVIGCGAIGSKVCLSLAKLGVKNLNVFDMDVVAEHNIANQAFSLKHIGMDKVAAVADICKEATGLNVSANKEFVDENTSLRGIIFASVDTMKGRKAILEAIKYKLTCPLFIDTRMGADIMRIYTIDPNNSTEVDAYEETLCADEDAEESYCGSKISVGPTSGIVSEIAVWQFLKMYNDIEVKNDKDIHSDAKERDNSKTFEIIYSLRPDYYMAKPTRKL
jgi:molybdopterin/thiamine biosynthesis adenylyltransferase